MLGKPLKLQYVSDLHLEHYKIHKEGELNPHQWLDPDPEADALILAGDIGWPEKPAYGLFLAWCSANWPRVFVVAGNHEFYTPSESFGHGELFSRHDKLEFLRLTAKSLPNVHFLERERVELAPGIWVLGATLWSDIPEDLRKYAVQGLNDFRSIRGTDLGDLTTFDEYKRWHRRDREWLEGELAAVEAEGGKAIVVTHHIPTYKLIHEKYAENPMNCCYATDLEQLIQSQQPLAWICGHSHTAKQMRLGRTQLALNPWGYPGEKVETRCRRVVMELPAPTGGTLKGVV